MYLYGSLTNRMTITLGSTNNTDAGAHQSTICPHLNRPFDLSKRQGQAGVSRPCTILLGIAEHVHLLRGTGQHSFHVPAVHERWSRNFLAEEDWTLWTGVKANNRFCPRCSNRMMGGVNNCVYSFLKNRSSTVLHHQQTKGRGTRLFYDTGLKIVENLLVCWTQRSLLNNLLYIPPNQSFRQTPKEGKRKIAHPAI